MSPVLEKITKVLNSKAYPWILLGVILALGIVYFVYAWLGYAPSTGPDVTDPWKGRQ